MDRLDTARRYLALLLLITVPPGVVFWFLVHPLTRLWRRVGPAKTYVVVGLSMVVCGVGLFRVRGTLLGRDLGTSWPLAGLGVVLVVAAWRLQRARARYLTLRFLVGLPELDPERRPGRLLTEGIYSHIRHPRYVEFTVAVLGYALLANYVGTYGLVVGVMVGLAGVVALEERELEDRFGDEFRRYRARVPRFIPRWR